MAVVKYILFDAANTLIHKPTLWQNYRETLAQHGYLIDEKLLKHHHTLISETIQFPDVTSETFYAHFNTVLINSLGIVENKKLLSDIFLSCKNLPWEAFLDVEALNELHLPLGVLSNFNSSLRQLLSDKIQDVPFKHLFISEELKVAKPNVEIFEKAISTIGLNPEEILYIGDSLKLDVKPALAVGMQAKLIDRQALYPASKYSIESLAVLTKL